MKVRFVHTRAGALRGLGAVGISAVFIFGPTAWAQAPKKTAPKSNTIIIASPEDEAKAAKQMSILHDAAGKSEAAKKAAENWGKAAEEAVARYAKAEGAVKAAADKLIAAYREGKALNEELAEAYRMGNASKVETLQDRIKKNSRSISMLREAPQTRVIEASHLLEETATREKAGAAAVSDIFEKWAASRKTAGEAAHTFGDLLMSDTSTDTQVDDARDVFTIAHTEVNAYLAYMRTMISIRQKQAAAGVTQERSMQLSQAEKMAAELLTATREQAAALVKQQKLGRQIDAALAEARLAISGAASAPVKPPANRTTNVKPQEKIDLTGKKPDAKTDPKKKH